MARLTIMLVVVVLAVRVAAAEEQTCFGPGDADGSSFVNLDDWSAVEACLSGPNGAVPPGCDVVVFDRADADGDGDVDTVDVAQLTRAFGAGYFAYGPRRDNLEAELLAMSLAGTLRAPDAEYARIVRDLGLIRMAYPELQNEPDAPDFLPTQLLVGIDAGTEPDPEYRELNAFYLLVDEEEHSFWRLLTFCDNLNAEVLVDIYAAVPGVNWADPNWLVGTDNIYTIEVDGTTYRYDIDDGFLDCFDGCDCHRHYVIEVSESGTVTLVLYEEYGFPYCDFG
jgi:hypothetical protein